MKSSLNHSQIENICQNKTRSVFGPEFRRNIKNMKLASCSRGNRNIINYGRFISTNKVSPKISNPSNIYLNSLEKFKRSLKNDSEENVVDQNSNCTDKTNAKSDFLLTKLAHQSKTIKTCSLAESGKFFHMNRRRYKSIDNEELQKIVNTKTNESPSQIRNTVNKWLKETLPSIAIDSDHFITSLKTNVINQSTFPTTQNDEIPKEMMKQFEKIEKCCEDLLANSRSSNSKSYFRAVNFYQLLGNLYKSLKLINTRRKSNVFELKNDILNEAINNSTQEVPSCKTLDIERDGDLSSLDERSKLSNMVNYMYNVKRNVSKNLLSEVKENCSENDTSRTGKGRIASSKDSLNYANLLIGQLLSNPKLCMKSKCVVGIYDHFIEEQYVVSSFRLISKKEREAVLKEEIRKKIRSLNGGGELINVNNLSNIYLDKRIQTSDTTISERKYSECPKTKQTGLSQTSSKKYVPIFSNTHGTSVKKVDRLGSSISKTLENEKAMFRSDNREFEDSLNDEIKQSSFTSNASDILQKNNDRKNRNKNYKLNQILLFKANSEYFKSPMYVIQENDFELNSLKVYSSSVMNVFDIATDTDIKDKLLMANLYEITSYFKCPRLPKPIECFFGNHSQHKPNNGNLDTSVNFKNNTPSGIEYTNDYLKMSLIEQRCQKIKNSLERNANIPGNIGDFLERLLKLQEILESIPRDKFGLSFEGMEENESTESTCSDMNRLISSCEQYLEEDQHPTGVGDRIGGLERNELSTNHIVLRNDKSPGTVTSEMVSKFLKRDNTDKDWKDEQQSEVANSLSILENLIDDFLKQNGLANDSKR